MATLVAKMYSDHRDALVALPKWGAGSISLAGGPVHSIN